MSAQQTLSKFLPNEKSINLKMDPELFFALLKEADPRLAQKVLLQLLGNDNIHLIRREAKGPKNRRRDQQHQNRQNQEVNNVFRLY